MRGVTSWLYASAAYAGYDPTTKKLKLNKTEERKKRDAEWVAKAKQEQLRKEQEEERERAEKEEHERREREREASRRRAREEQDKANQEANQVRQLNACQLPLAAHLADPLLHHELHGMRAR